jgi:hypothetical protein
MVLQTWKEAQKKETADAEQPTRPAINGTEPHLVVAFCLFSQLNVS